MLDCPLPCLFQRRKQEIHTSLLGRLLGNKYCCCNFLASEMTTSPFSYQCTAQPASGIIPGEGICSARGAGAGDGRSRDHTLLVMVAQIMWAFWATPSAVPILCLWPHSEIWNSAGWWSHCCPPHPSGSCSCAGLEVMLVMGEPDLLFGIT